MKKQLLLLLAFVIALATSVQAQPRMGNPGFNSAVAKLFGDTTAFTADLEIRMVVSAQQATSMPGKLAFDSGNSRFEMNLSDAKGGQMPQGFADHMKAMGMDKTITISRRTDKLVYMIYPGLSAYTESPMHDAQGTNGASEIKPQMTELGRETVDGHACVKNKVAITDDQGKGHEFTTWNAIDLKKFPIKIEMSEQGHLTTMLFTNVKTSKPDSALFEPPSDYKKYASQQELQMEMMKRMQGMMQPPAHP